MDETLSVSVFDHDDPEFEAALAVRERVFVEEQGVPYDREADGRDPEATHFLGRVVGEGKPVAVARVREYGGDSRADGDTGDGGGDADAVKVERVAVVADRRGEGYGDGVMDAVESYAREAGYDRLVLDAQVPVVGFYERRGYRVQDDEPFEDAGIPHRRMAKPTEE